MKRRAVGVLLFALEKTRQEGRRKGRRREEDLGHSAQHQERPEADVAGDDGVWFDIVPMEDTYSRTCWLTQPVNTSIALFQSLGHSSNSSRLAIGA